MSTKRTLSHFGGRKDRYRAYLEAGKGEKPVSTFERAYAGLVLGGEAFVERIRRLTETESGEDSGAQPALSVMRRLAKAEAEEVEQLVSEQLAGEVPRRQRRLVLYALRKHSRLRPSEIARRCGRTPAAGPLHSARLGQGGEREQRPCEEAQVPGQGHRPLKDEQRREQ